MKNLLKDKRLIVVIGGLLVLLIGSLFLFVKNEIIIVTEPIPYNPPVYIVSMISDANYFNEIDGSYYSDADFKNKATDNTKVLQAAINRGGIVYIPNGNYLIEGKIILANKYINIKGESKEGTRLVFTGNKAPKHKNNPEHSSIILNDGFSFTYNKNKSQELNMSNFTMLYYRHDNDKPVTLMLLGNIDKANIENMLTIGKSKQGTDNIGINNLDLYASCKNVTINLCEFINDTNGPYGGCIWVRNLSGKTKNVLGSETKNITISNNKFRKNSNDEIIAIYSVCGNVEDVNVFNNEFITYNRVPSIAFTICSANDEYEGVVKNVSVYNNKFFIHDFVSFVIQIGNHENKKNGTSDIFIDSNTFELNTDTINEKFAIYKADSVSSKISIKNNTLTNTSSSQSKIIGISASNESIENNKLYGEFFVGLENGYMRNNTINGSKTGVLNPIEATNNEITASTGIKTITPKTKVISNNNITLIKDGNKTFGIGVLELAGDTINVECKENNIYSEEEDISYFFAVGTVNFLNNNSYNNSGMFMYKNEKAIILANNN